MIVVVLIEIPAANNPDTVEESIFKLLKFGQYPSIADLEISRIRDYTKVLVGNKLKEFTKAIGLAAHGVGIGSFVYLRRIFEHLLEEAHQKAKSDEGWNEDQYKGFRVDEKINFLRSHLPKFLVDNKVIYKILSKGIHELEEDECLLYFEPLKAGIEQILDEKLELKRKEEALKKANEALKKILSNLK